jgi:ribonuclease G
VLKPRQELLVQVMKDPMGSKGARLTGQLSLAGRYLVYVPGGSGVGVSRRLGAAERDRLRELCKELRPRKAGLIVRTVAEGKGLDELRRDLQYLSRLWSRLKARADKVTAPGLVYEEADVSLQVARDLFNDTFEAVIIDEKKQRDKFAAYLAKEAPELADRVRAYEGDVPLFDAYGIEEQIAKALERRVRLLSGGNIVIDHAEALTVIDVNTGRYTAGRNLEETITKTNLEAAVEVVRQLRLRDIGGIIIIDFIDMAYARNRDAVLAKLQAELDTDRTKTYVVEISPLGLVEMTRQNITDGARGVLTKECPSCSGKARILSEDTAARNAVRALRRQTRTSPHQAFLYEVNHSVGERVAKMGWLKALEKETRKHIYFEGSQALPVDHLRLIVGGTREDVERQRVPVREGQELEVELEHTLTYSPGDAVAHVDGYEITVVGGRQSLGKRRTVKVTSMSRTGAFATLMGKGRH